MEVGGPRSGGPLTAPGGASSPLKPLKTKKSLTRLFSTSAKVSSRSRPPSPEDLPTPPTPSIPESLWPLTSEASPRIPSLAFDNFMSQVIDQDHVETKSQTSRAPSTFNKQATPSAGKRTIVRNISEPIDRKSHGMDEPCMAEGAKALPNQSVERPTVQDAPTFPDIPKRSAKDARMPPSFSSIPRGRGSSVSTPKPRGTLVQSQVSRPSTAGGERRS